jgi:hypothetical protein
LERIPLRRIVQCLDSRLPDNGGQIDVDNRDSHCLSHFEIASAKRISQHLSVFVRKSPEITSNQQTLRSHTGLSLFAKLPQQNVDSIGDEV